MHSVRAISLVLLVFSTATYAECIIPLQEGGWAAEGGQGLVEVFFEPNNTVNIQAYHEAGDTMEVEGHVGSWVCVENSVTIEIGKTSVIGKIKVVDQGEEGEQDDMLGILFPQEEGSVLSNRVLLPFTY